MNADCRARDAARRELEGVLRVVMPGEVPLPFGLSRLRLESYLSHLREDQRDSTRGTRGDAADRGRARAVIQRILDAGLAAGPLGVELGDAERERAKSLRFWTAWARKNPKAAKSLVLRSCGGTP